MTVTFFDLQDESNPLNGVRIDDTKAVVDILYRHRNRPPFLCELVGSNGYKLLVGIGPKVAYLQHSPNDGNLPYLMAVAPNSDFKEGEIEFLAGGTLTPILLRHCLSFEAVNDIAAEFQQTGQRSSTVEWEEI